MVASTVTDMQEFLEQLAANPGTPPALLSHLVTYALSARAGTNRGETVGLAAALLANPALADAQTTALLGIPTKNSVGEQGRLLKALTTRPGLSTAHLLSLLGPAPTHASVITVLSSRADPDGDLARYALEHTPGVGVWTAVCRYEDNPLPLRQQAACALGTCGRQLAGASLTYLRHVAHDVLVQARGTGAGDEACTWVQELAAATSSDQLRKHLQVLLDTRTAPVGSAQWLKHPLTATDDVLTWLEGSSSPAVYARAVRSHVDRTGTLAGHALDVFGQHALVAGAVLSDAHACVQVRQRAYRALRSVEPARINGHKYSLLDQSDPGFVLEHLQHDPPVLSYVMRRTDLTTEDLLAVHEYVTRNPRSLNARSDISADRYGWWLATYPTATSKVSRLGLAYLQRASSPWAAQACTVVRALIADGPAAAGGQFAGPLLTDFALRRVPGVAWLLGAALAEHLDGAMDQAAAVVLTSLAGDFTGTVGDLLATAAAVAA